MKNKSLCIFYFKTKLSKQNGRKTSKLLILGSRLQALVVYNTQVKETQYRSRQYRNLRRLLDD